MPLRSAPFQRAREMAAAIADAYRKFTDDIIGRTAALGDIGTYKADRKSNGQHHSKRCVAWDKRDARKARNRKNHKRHL